MTEQVPPKLHVPTMALDNPVQPSRYDAGTEHRPPPVHPVAAMLLLLVDNLWNLADWAVIDWIFTVPLSFITVFVPTFLIQRVLKRDGWGRAFVLALMLGFIGAIPTSVTGTPVGVALLAWFGIDRLLGRNRQKTDLHGGQ
jgi:hypothetical protein